MLRKIIRYQVRDMVRSKWVFLLFFFLLIISSGMFRLAENYEKVFSSLVSVTVLLLPLIGLLLGIIVYFNARDYMLFLLAQPIKRGTIYLGMVTGMIIPFSIIVIIGLGLPLLIFGEPTLTYGITAIVLLSVAVFLSSACINIAFLISVITDDKVYAIGLGLFLWLLLSVVYDGLVLLAALSYSDYPLEMPMLIFSILNPIDLARIISILRLDIATLMGYTGRLFQLYFGGVLGTGFAFVILLLWSVLPYFAGSKRFKKKDF